MQMWMDLCSTLAVAAAARLGIADVLADAAPQECAALARAVGADATALTRLSARPKVFWHNISLNNSKAI
jgi:hypothetical protein